MSAVAATPTAARHGLLTCLECGQLNRTGTADAARCARCAAPLHRRKPDSIARAWAFLAAAAIVYIPANVLPVLQTSELGTSRSDTILSGVVNLWQTGSWVLAAIVFVASIVVPGTKVVALALLLATSQRRSPWRPLDRTRLYRLTAYIGRWSMVDIYVGATMVALVQLRPFAQIEPGPGAIAFGLVVILTMLASESFDPRLIWDPLDEPPPRAAANPHE